MEERISMHPHKPPAASQPSRCSHAQSLTAQLAQPLLTAPELFAPFHSPHTVQKMTISGAEADELVNDC